MAIHVGKLWRKKVNYNVKGFERGHIWIKWCIFLIWCVGDAGDNPRYTSDRPPICHMDTSFAPALNYEQFRINGHYMSNFRLREQRQNKPILCLKTIPRFVVGVTVRSLYTWRKNLKHPSKALKKLFFLKKKKILISFVALTFRAMNLNLEPSALT